jgi:general secretion pathway protein N
MRADAAGAKTWLLGGVALWALAFWALGLFGLGARIERLAEDPSLLQRLPQAAAAVEERLGPLPRYAEIGDRPLFTDDRRPQPFFINAEGEEEDNSFDFVLTSVLLTPGLEMAILHPLQGGEPVRLRVGEAPESSPAWQLASVNPRSVVFSGPEGEQTLELRVFDGVGGEAPTLMAVPRPQLPAGTNRALPARPPAPDEASATIPVTTSSSQTPVPVAVPAPPPQPVTDPATTVQTPDAQVEAIRQRIEARRAQLRQQAQEASPPAQEETP